MRYMEFLFRCFTVDSYYDLVKKDVGFRPPEDPFTEIKLVISDCPITYIPATIAGTRKKREVPTPIAAYQQRTKRAVSTSYDTVACHSVFYSSSLSR